LYIFYDCNEIYWDITIGAPSVSAWPRGNTVVVSSVESCIPSNSTTFWTKRLKIYTSMVDRITENDPSASSVEEVSLEEEKPLQYDGLSKHNPIVRTYLYPPDVSSLKKYFILVFLISGALMFFLGPLAQVFVVEPLVTLLLSDASMVTPDKACYNPRLANQTCEDEVHVDYYFWNITNRDEVRCSKYIFTCTCASLAHVVIPSEQTY